MEVGGGCWQGRDGGGPPWLAPPPHRPHPESIERRAILRPPDGAPPGARRRRRKPIYVGADEAAAIEKLADPCELSISELVAIAIEWWYGASTPAT